MSTYTAKEEQNLTLVRDFFEIAIKKFDVDALGRFIKPDYIQHAPAAADRVTFAAFPWCWKEGDGCIVRLVAIVDKRGDYRIESGDSK